MKKVYFLLAVLAAFTLCGCTVNHHDQWENEKIDSYKQLESNKNYYQLATETYEDLKSTSKKMEAYLIPVWQSKAFGDAVITGVISESKTIVDYKESSRLKQILNELAERNSFVSEKAKNCLEQMDNILKERITNKSLKILMNEIPSHYTEKSIKKSAYIFSIEKLKSSSDLALFNSVVNYVYENKNMQSSFKKDIQNIRVIKAMLDNAKLEEILSTDYIKFKNRIPQLNIMFDKNDKLMGLDVCSALNRDQRFILSQNYNKNNTIITVEKLAFDVQNPTVEKKTVTINQANVDLLKAAFLMPRNASYQFETVTQSSGISYAYMITAEKSGRKHEYLLRENFVQHSVSCENMRTHNVFGGIQAANWYPNQDVQNMCTNNANIILSYESMKKNIADKIAISIINTLENYNFIPKDSSLKNSSLKNIEDPGWLE